MTHVFHINGFFLFFFLSNTMSLIEMAGHKVVFYMLGEKSSEYVHFSDLTQLENK